MTDDSVTAGTSPAKPPSSRSAMWQIAIGLILIPGPWVALFLSMVFPTVNPNNTSYPAEANLRNFIANAELAIAASIAGAILLIVGIVRAALAKTK